MRCLTQRPAQAKKRIKGIFREAATVSGVIALAKPRRIKASHRRRRRVASDHLLYILNNPLSGTDPTGYACTTGTKIQGEGGPNCESTGATGSPLGENPTNAGAKAIKNSGGNGGSGGQSSTSESRNESGGGIASRIKTAVGRAFVPNAQDLQDRGEPGSALDDAKGFGKGLLNKGVGLINTGINATPVFGFYNHFNPDSQIAVPEVSIANKELPGAFASDVVALVASAFAPKVVGKGGGGAVGEVAEGGAPSMRRPAEGRGVQDAASQEMHGPYHRLGDSAENIARIRETGELRGNPSRNTHQSDIPAVRAYRGPLPDGARGFEFYTPVAPNRYSVPSKPVWSLPSPGVMSRGDQVAIPCTVTCSRP